MLSLDNFSRNISVSLIPTLLGYIEHLSSFTGFAILTASTAVLVYILRTLLGEWIVEKAREIAKYAHFYAEHHPKENIRNVAKIVHDILPKNASSYSVHDNFIELSERYLSKQEPDPNHWRTELEFPEIEAGYNISRHTLRKENEFAAETIMNLLMNQNVVLLGEAGSGKSVVCRSVACRWYRTYGVVFYSYGTLGELSDPDRITKMIDKAIEFDEILVVVEDAARYERRRIFDVVDNFEDDDRVQFLFDSRKSEWEEFDSKISDVDRTRIKNDAFQTETLSDIKELDVEKLINSISETANTNSMETISPKDVMPPQNGQAVGTMLQVIYNILLSTDAGSNNTMLEADVQRKFNASDPEFTHQLPDRCRLSMDAVESIDDRDFHKVAIGVNILNAMGQPIRKPFLYALTSTDDHESIRQVLRVLENWMLFDEPRDGVYRTFPESWSLLYLEEMLENPLSKHLFTECVKDFISVLASPEVRKELQTSTVMENNGWLDEIDTKQTQLLDGFIIDLFEFNTRKPKLGTLLRTLGISDLPISEKCSAFVEIQARIYRGIALRHRDRDQAREAFENAHQLADTKIESPKRTRLFRLQCHRRLGNIAFHGGDFETAKSHYRDCLREYDSKDPYRERALCRANLGASLHDTGQSEEALDQLQQGQKECEPLPPNSFAKALINHNLGAVHKTLGNYGDSQYHLKASQNIARKNQEWNIFAWNKNRLANLHLNRGSLSVAESHLKNAQNIARKRGFTAVNAWSENDLATVEIKRGEHGDALYHLETATALNKSLDNSQLSAWIQYQRGIIFLEQNEIQDAREHLRESLKVARQNEYDQIHSWNRLAFTRTFLKESNRETAMNHLRKGLTKATEIKDRLTVAKAIYEAGRFHQCFENEELAKRLFREALQRFNVLGCRYETKRTIDVLLVEFDLNKSDLSHKYEPLESLSVSERREIEKAVEKRFSTQESRSSNGGSDLYRHE